jgi:hypothetical protein
MLIRESRVIGMSSRSRRGARLDITSKDMRRVREDWGVWGLSALSFITMKEIRANRGKGTSRVTKGMWKYRKHIVLICMF